ncbi:GNAT family N-acetyltransferase [Lacrimispora sp.]|jgi:ribosomal protein S18 acetylase RimI-like enzyme|uniref:GNAT family N-acetyltransferase n=1 Tax=Lacrimispora sp. TaxID=2719234 RepID=UPI00289AEDB7|nr:GNAT family N-acetyltransferase [Lacrimispora sp.]
MKIEEITYASKNGEKVVLRSPEISDSKDLLEYLVTCAGETDYLGRYPEEITKTVDEENSYICKQLEDEKSFDVSAFVDNKLVANGTIYCIRGNMKTKHRAGYGIAVLRDYWDMGIGNMLTKCCLNNAKKLGYEQVELEVVADNKRAVHVYEQHGFKVCGTIENAEKLKDGTYRDLHMMICKL